VCRKKGGGVCFVGNPSYVVEGNGVVWRLPSAFCVLLCTFCELLLPFRRGVGVWAIFRMASCMKSALRTIALIVRFWGIILGRVGPFFLRSKWFVLPGFEMGRKFVGLTTTLTKATRRIVGLSSPVPMCEGPGAPAAWVGRGHRDRGRPPKGNSRFPSGMTDREARTRAKAKARRRIEVCPIEAHPSGVRRG